MVTDLCWVELDPATHEFDPEAARAAVTREVLATAAGDVADREREQLVERIHRTFVAEYGAWAAGWQWAASEPGGGGPVGNWCCARDSVLRDDDPGPETTIERALAALAAWRNYLVELGDTFAELADATRELALEDRIERAGAALLPIVIQATRAEDAWYNTFAAVLCWFAEPLVDDLERVRAVVKQTVSGRFESWMEPSPDVARETFTAAGIAVGEADAVAEPRDALPAWLEVRAKAFQRAPQELARAPLDADGHVRFIERVDRPRDPVRADRMLAALEMCRASARSGMPLTLGQLSEWQAIVLGERRLVELRTGDAFGKRGRERYRLLPDLREQFERALAGAADAMPIAIRAARAYLDVCFFHPFPDGNGRAARLALDHVVTAAGLGLHAADPLFVLSRSAGDGSGAWRLAYVTERMLGVRR